MYNVARGTFLHSEKYLTKQSGIHFFFHVAECPLLFSPFIIQP